MIKMEKAAATGFLYDILSDVDERDVLRTENRMLLAVKMANALKKKKISQKQFAEMMGKSTTVVSEWLSGDRNFTVDTLTDIGYVLGINLLNTEPESELTITDQYSTADVKMIKFVSLRTTASLTHDGQNYVETVDKLKVV